MMMTFEEAIDIVTTYGLECRVCMYKDVCCGYSRIRNVSLHTPCATTDFKDLLQRCLTIPLATRIKKGEPCGYMLNK